MLKENNIKGKRENFIDTVKGIGILLIVLGHIIIFDNKNEDFFCTFIYSFHVPIFFIVAGMLMNFKKLKYDEIKVWDYAKKKFNKLLYPYFMFSFLFILYLFIKYLWGYVSLINIFKTILNIVFLFGEGPAWFLPTLYFSEIITIFIMKYKNKKYNVILFYVMSVIWIIITNVVFRFEIWERNIIFEFVYKILNLATRSIIGVLFIYIGYKIFDKTYIDKIPSVIAVIILLINLFLSQYNNRVDIHYSIVNNIFLFFYLSISSSVSIVSLCYKFLNNDNVFSFFGQNSLIIMLTHITFPVIELAKIITNMMRLKNENLNVIVSFIITMLIECAIITLINKKMIFLVRSEYKKYNPTKHPTKTCEPS